MNPIDWKYLSEGGANLLVAYVGPTSTNTNKLLRIKKSKINQLDSRTSRFGNNEVEFQKEVISKLLGVEWIVEMLELKVEKGFLISLRDKLRADGVRPTARAEGDEIDIKRDSVIILDNLLDDQDTLLVEIKPKWGFFPSPKYLAPATSQLKLQRCRFCRHRDYRNRGKEVIADAVQYCPMNLFNRDQKRIEKGVEGLWNGWIKTEGTGNNFRIALDGKWLNPNDSSTLSELSNFFDTSTPISVLQETISNFLFTSEFLPKLQNLQSSLDPLDIEGLAKVYLNQTGQLLNAFDQYEEPNVEQWKKWIHRWKDRNLSDESEFRMMDYIMAYLLSATFKDCSILIRIRKMEGRKDYKVILQVIDLDAKSITKLSSYQKLDRLLLATLL